MKIKELAEMFDLKIEKRVLNKKDRIYVSGSFKREVTCYVHLSNFAVQDYKGSSVICYPSGYGKTTGEALQEYCEKIKGLWGVVDERNIVNRIEFQIPKTLTA